MEKSRAGITSITKKFAEQGVKISFYKYQAAGNDFVLVDNRAAIFHFSTAQIARICDRRFGAGADGLILLSLDKDADFRIDYFNPDGTASLCGNGCRSAVALAARLGLAGQHSVFNAYDGLHDAELTSDGQIRIRMADVAQMDKVYDGWSLDTGSPHFVRWVSGLEAYPVVEEGRRLRYDPVFPRGTNANFIELIDDQTLALRTYERGVEEETLACGTGATASALAASVSGYKSPISLKVRGGILRVEFNRRPDGTFTDIYLTGPAQLVYTGELELA